MQSLLKSLNRPKIGTAHITPGANQNKKKRKLGESKEQSSNDDIMGLFREENHSKLSFLSTGSNSMGNEYFNKMNSYMNSNAVPSDVANVSSIQPEYSDFDSIPLDYSLCTGISITSTAKLNWLYESTGYGSNSEICNFLSYYQYPCESLPEFVLSAMSQKASNKAMNNNIHAYYGFEGLDSKVNNENILTNNNEILHEDNFMKTTINTSINNQKFNNDISDEDHLFNRKCLWGKAFRSLSQKFLKSLDDTHFYYVDANYVILFVSLNYKSTVLVSRSNSSFRRELKMNGVSFTQPLNKNVKKQKKEEDQHLVIEELEKYQQDATTQLGSGKITRSSSFVANDDDAAASSLLSITDDLSIQSLITFLINKIVKRNDYGNHKDVPLLLSAHSFQNATCKQIRPSLPNKITFNSYNIKHKSILNGTIIHSFAAILSQVFTSISETFDSQIKKQPDLDEFNQIEIRKKLHHSTLDFNTVLKGIYPEEAFSDPYDLIAIDSDKVTKKPGIKFVSN